MPYSMLSRVASRQNKQSRHSWKGGLARKFCALVGCAAASGMPRERVSAPLQPTTDVPQDAVYASVLGESISARTDPVAIAIGHRS
jgi:hypothetical protein